MIMRLVFMMMMTAMMVVLMRILAIMMMTDIMVNMIWHC